MEGTREDREAKLRRQNVELENLEVRDYETIQELNELENDHVH